MEKIVEVYVLEDAELDAMSDERLETLRILIFNEICKLDEYYNNILALISNRNFDKNKKVS